MSIGPDRDGDVTPRIDAALDPGPVATNPLLEISNATVRVYKQVFGRGPTYARARFAGADTLVVLLQDSMTATERTLVALGEHGRVREQRQLLRGAVDGEMRAMVERILARRTLALIHGIDTERDVAVEVFLLACTPAPDPQP
jgi:uncharacterized protein YbcI